MVKNVLSFSILIFAIISVSVFAAAPTNTLGIITSPSSITVLDGENFTIDLSLESTTFESKQLVTSFDSSQLNLVSPPSTLNLWGGTYAMDITYYFTAISSGNSTITFISNDVNEAVQTINVEVLPVFVQNNIEQNSYDVYEGETFDLTTRIVSENSEDVYFYVEYDEQYLTTDYPNVTELGEGTFEEIITMPFTASIIEDNPNQIITTKVCSIKGCDERQISVNIESLELDVDSSISEISPEGTFQITADIKTFNQGDGAVTINYDSNWFELTGSDTIRIEENTVNQIVFSFNMKKEGPGCPQPDFDLKLTTSENTITDSISISPINGIFLSSNIDDSIMNVGDKLNFTVYVKTFGISRGSYELKYSQEYMTPEKYFATSGSISSECVETTYEYDFELVKNTATLDAPNESAKINFIVYKSSSTIPPIRINRFDFGGKIATLSTVSILDQIEEEIYIIFEQPENTEEIEIICALGSYNNETGRCEYYPEIEIICSRGTYNNETDKCQYRPASERISDKKFICEEGIYNSETEYCEISPETEIKCSEGSFNQESNLCIIDIRKIISVNKDEIAVLKIESDKEIEDIIILSDAVSISEKTINNDSAILMLAFEEVGRHSVKIEIENKDGTIISKDYIFDVKSGPITNSMTGMFGLNATRSLLGMFIILLISLSIIGYKYQKSIKPWQNTLR